MAKRTSSADATYLAREAALVFPDFRRGVHDDEGAPGAKLHAGSHRVMAVLRAMADANGTVMCTKNDLAAAVGSCVRTVDSAVRDLRNNGYLQVTPCFSENGAQVGNTYQILGDPGLSTERRGRPIKGATGSSSPS